MGHIVVLQIAGGVEGIHEVILRPVARRADLVGDFNDLRYQNGFSAKEGLYLRKNEVVSREPLIWAPRVSMKTRIRRTGQSFHWRTRG